MTERASFTEKTQLLVKPPTDQISLKAAIAQIVALANKLGLERREILSFTMSETITIPKHSLLELTWSPLRGAEATKRAESKEAAAYGLLQMVLGCHSEDDLTLAKVKIQEFL